ncbi:PREDICTED: myeloid leukemia factor isoform X2 [Wasmannia auropunctata]|uniref:myeloid leukemia factor isoform X2 n=1 Tax=Wasmannia auropunctata TaxID=64793 RepID=UPI0005EFE3DB|nr:PREDICTED: myeloid leukemia factor isoform X2 [Wasmannia auropunctata]
MSLFGFMGDDDIFNIFGPSGAHMRQMNSMMNSMFANPFEMMGPNALMPSYRRGLHNDMPVSIFEPHFGRFGLNSMPNNGHSFMSQSVMTMSSGPDGRPQVYQETMSTRMAPGGIKETKQTVSDSRTGTRKMAIGHHIGERAHILERERNLYHGDEEERQEFINLDEEEAESFNREWESRTRRTAGAIEGAHPASNVRVNPEPRQLALPSTTDVPASFKSTQPAASSRAETSTTLPTSTSGSRKREHKPDRQVSNKRHAVPASNN